MWPATQSCMLSKYPDALEVMCRSRLTALQFSGFVLLVMLGHSLCVSPVPVTPPRRIWTTYNAAAPALLALTFCSIRTAPAVPPFVVWIGSCIYTVPISPSLPVYNPLIGTREFPQFPTCSYEFHDEYKKGPGSRLEGKHSESGLSLGVIAESRSSKLIRKYLTLYL